MWHTYCVAVWWMSSIYWFCSPKPGRPPLSIRQKLKMALDISRGEFICILWVTFASLMEASGREQKLKSSPKINHFHEDLSLYEWSSKSYIDLSLQVQYLSYYSITFVVNCRIYCPAANLLERMQIVLGISFNMIWHSFQAHLKNFGSSAGMHYLHSAKPPIIHRDLKSMNLLVDNDLTIKVCPITAVLLTQTRLDMIVLYSALSPLWLDKVHYLMRKSSNIVNCTWSAIWSNL